MNKEYNIPVDNDIQEGRSEQYVQFRLVVINWHSRWTDNIMIERWFRSFKYKEAYLTQYNNSFHIF